MADFVGRLLSLYERKLAWMETRILLCSRGIEAESGLRINRFVRLRAYDGGTIQLGQNVSIGRFAEFSAKRGRIVIGPDSFIGQGSVIVACDEVLIGKGCLIAEYVTVRDQDHAFGAGESQAKINTGRIVVGDDVWIGAKATVTRGVTIGSRSVIGANCVVTSDVPENCLFAGVPGRVLKYF